MSLPMDLHHQLTDREGHAALSSSSERSSDDRVERKVLVRIRHDDAVVFMKLFSTRFVSKTKQKRTLRSQVGLDTLSERSSGVVDVLSGLVRSNKRDGLDSGLFAEELDGRDASVQHGEDTLGQTSLLSELGNDHGRSRVALRRLEYKRVSSGNRHGD